SYITPPVAVAAYVASTIADEPPMAVAVRAVQIGVAAFLLPFAFVYNPGMLLIGEWPEIVFQIAKVTFGILILAAALEGWYYGNLGRGMRGAMILTSLLAFSAWHVVGAAAVALVGGYLLSRRLFPKLHQRTSRTNALSATANTSSGECPMIALHDISYLRLGCKDLDEMVQFGTRILGLELRERTATHAYLRGDNSVFNLCYIQGDASYDASAFALREYAHLQQAADELQALGITVQWGDEAA